MRAGTTKRRKNAGGKSKHVNYPLVDLLDSWLNVDEDDAREQRETMQYLRKALDENRPPGYKLFS